MDMSKYMLPVNHMIRLDQPIYDFIVVVLKGSVERVMGYT